MQKQFVPTLLGILQTTRKKTDGDQIIISYIPFQKMMPQTQKFIQQNYSNLKTLTINNCDLRTFQNFPYLKSIQNLDVSNNSLQGSFQFIVKNKTLQYINASKNYISNTNNLAPLRTLKGINLYIKQNTVCQKDGFATKIRQYYIKLLKQPKQVTIQTKPIDLVKDQIPQIQVKQKKEAIDNYISFQQKQNLRMKQKYLRLKQVRRIQRQRTRNNFDNQNNLNNNNNQNEKLIKAQIRLSIMGQQDEQNNRNSGFSDILLRDLAQLRRINQQSINTSNNSSNSNNNDYIRREETVARILQIQNNNNKNVENNLINNSNQNERYSASFIKILRDNNVLRNQEFYSDQSSSSSEEQIQNQEQNNFEAEIDQDQDQDEQQPQEQLQNQQQIERQSQQQIDQNNEQNLNNLQSLQQEQDENNNNNLNDQNSQQQQDNQEIQLNQQQRNIGNRSSFINRLRQNLRNRNNRNSNDQIRGTQINNRNNNNNNNNSFNQLLWNPPSQMQLNNMFLMQAFSDFDQVQAINQVNIDNNQNNEDHYCNFFEDQLNQDQDEQ